MGEILSCGRGDGRPSKGNDVSNPTKPTTVSKKKTDGGGSNNNKPEIMKTEALKVAGQDWFRILSEKDILFICPIFKWQWSRFFIRVVVKKGQFPFFQIPKPRTSFQHTARKRTAEFLSFSPPKPSQNFCKKGQITDRLTSCKKPFEGNKRTTPLFETLFIEQAKK